VGTIPTVAPLLVRLTFEAGNEMMRIVSTMPKRTASELAGFRESWIPPGVDRSGPAAGGTGCRVAVRGRVTAPHRPGSDAGYVQPAAARRRARSRPGGADVGRH
jgi:hypothetical protein